jgi:hypothetical protein
MMRTLAICTVLFAAAPVSAAEAGSKITALLNEFLGKVDDAAMHDRFWADDLIYTSAAGVVKTKAQILASMRETPAAGKADEPKSTFGAEEVKVRSLAADVAVLNFRLVHHLGDKTDHFRNSGTFVRRNGRWQAVSWQATREEK